MDSLNTAYREALGPISMLHGGLCRTSDNIVLEEEES